MQILDRGRITSVDDLVGLNIIDFGRNNGKLFGGTHNAINAVANHCVQAMSFTIICDDLSVYRKPVKPPSL